MNNITPILVVANDLSTNVGKPSSSTTSHDIPLNSSSTTSQRAPLEPVFNVAVATPVVNAIPNIQEPNKIVKLDRNAPPKEVINNVRSMMRSIKNLSKIFPGEKKAVSDLNLTMYKG